MTVIFPHFMAKYYLPAVILGHFTDFHPDRFPDNECCKNENYINRRTLFSFLTNVRHTYMYIAGVF